MIQDNQIEIDIDFLCFSHLYVGNNQSPIKHKSGPMLLQ